MTEKMVKLTLNGREVQAPEGENVLQVALNEGIDIPHFCYHPGIGVEGSCRLCLVEVEGLRNLQPSCNVVVKEGLVVRTNTPEVEEARRGVMEFFLLNHPLDCPICDKGGECPLQNFALDSGQSNSRMEFEKVHKDKHQVISDHIMLDKERCVLCNRCVRFLRNLTGREELQFRNRGVVTEIFVPEGKPLTNGFTGNLPDICPVGALTSREFRFQARPWELKTVDTICGECSLGCSVQTWTKKLNVLRMTPRVEGGVNEWWLCDRGRFSIKKNLKGNRLTEPRRTSGESYTGSLEEYVETLKEEIQKLSDGSFVIAADSTLTNEEIYALHQMVDVTSGRLFVQPKEALHQVYASLKASDREAHFPKDLDHADTVILAGENLEKDHPVLLLRLRRMLAAKQIDLFTVGSGSLGFEDVRKGHIEVSDSPADIQKFFKKLQSKSHEAFSEARKVHMLISDQWVSSETESGIRNWFKSCPEGWKFSLLLSGANTRGMLDQWDDKTFSDTLLEKEIQQGRVDGILWIGSVNEPEKYAEYFKGMKLFAQMATEDENCVEGAHWHIPLDTFLEKKGTYTNTFGRLRRLRRSTRVVRKGFQTLEFLSALTNALTGNKKLELSQMYENVSNQLPLYPKRLEEIPESKETYAYLERAQWR